MENEGVIVFYFFSFPVSERNEYSYNYQLSFCLPFLMDLSDSKTESCQTVSSSHKEAHTPESWYNQIKKESMFIMISSFKHNEGKVHV